MKLILRALCFILISNLVLNRGFSGADVAKDVPPGLNAIIWEQGAIENEGFRLAEEGFYDAAIAKYHEALAPRFIQEEGDRCHPLYGIMNVHRLQGKFDEALQEARWFLKINPKKEEYKDNQLELKALLEAQNTKLKIPIFQYVVYLFGKYKKLLPPIKYDGNYVPIIASRIIFCYGWSGDADRGIAFLDKIINYFASGKAGRRAKERAFTMRNPYFVIRQAFEQDKKEGFKGCLESKPGDACMGRAIKALIQSDYFPW
ncbi:MAG: hypothetical protein WC133_04125 [Candidatus Omnitrophota bacterium]